MKEDDRSLMRMLITNTRQKLEQIIIRVSNGSDVTLSERIDFQK